MRKRIAQLDNARRQMKAQASLLLDAGQDDLAIGLVELLTFLDEHIQTWQGTASQPIPTVPQR